MKNDLFRPEVLSQRSANNLGSTMLSQPVKLWVLTAAAVLTALAVILFLSFAKYTRRSQVIGQLVPTKGLAMILAPSTGVVSDVNVLEGDAVNSGAVLAVVAIPNSTLASGDTQDALSQQIQRRQQGLEAAHSARAQLLSTQNTGLTNQLASAQSELQQIAKEVATRTEQLQITQSSAERWKALGQKSYVSELQTEQQLAAALEQRSAVQSLQRQAIGVRRLMAQLQQSQAEIPNQLQANDANFQRETAQLEQELVEIQARGGLTAVAPVSGLVATQMVKPGQSVQLGQAMFSILPADEKLEAELLVPSRAIGFVEPGNLVHLRLQAFPYQKFGHQIGTVIRVSRSALVTQGEGTESQPYYRVTVALKRQNVIAYGRAEPLRPGMVLEADILSEQRRLIEWLFEPLFSLRGYIGGV